MGGLREHVSWCHTAPEAVSLAKHVLGGHSVLQSHTWAPGEGGRHFASTFPFLHSGKIWSEILWNKNEVILPDFSLEAAALEPCNK